VYRRAIVHEVTDTGDMTESVTTESDEHVSAGHDAKVDKMFGPPRTPFKRKLDVEDFADYQRVRIRDKPLEWRNVSGPSLASSSPPWLDEKGFGISSGLQKFSNPTQAQYRRPFAPAPLDVLYSLPRSRSLGPPMQDQKPKNLHLYDAKPFEFRCLKISCTFRFSVPDTVPAVSRAQTTLYNHCIMNHADEYSEGHDWERKLKGLVEFRIRETLYM
jgi:hypothetical protein